MADIAQDNMLIEVGKRIRHIRESQNLSETELAIKADISAVTESNMELGTTDSRLSSFFKVAQALGVSLEVIQPFDFDKYSAITHAVIEALIPYAKAFSQKTQKTQDQILSIFIPSITPLLANLMNNIN